MIKLTQKHFFIVISVLVTLGVGATKDPLTILLVPYYPMVECEINSTDLDKFDGASVKYLKALLSELNWSNSSYNVKCTSW